MGLKKFVAFCGTIIGFAPVILEVAKRAADTIGIINLHKDVPELFMKLSEITNGTTFLFLLMGYGCLAFLIFEISKSRWGNKKKRIPMVGMAVFGFLFLASTAWTFWPSKNKELNVSSKTDEGKTSEQIRPDAKSREALSMRDLFLVILQD